LVFEDLNLNTPLLNALSDLGLTEPTLIQQKVFSVVMSGRDVVGIAQTGTGKTFAYLLPILRQMSFSKQKEPRVLVVVPTRELVVQLVGEVKKLTTYINVRVEGVYGGTNINTQKLLVMNGVDILIATPGRLVHLAMSGYLNLKYVKQFVIDEMDEMLSLGFRAQLTSILDLLPTRRQSLLFSATMSEDVDDLIKTFFQGPVLVEAVRAGTPLERIQQQMYMVPNFYTKLNLLEHILATDETSDPREVGTRDPPQVITLGMASVVAQDGDRLLVFPETQERYRRIDDPLGLGSNRRVLGRTRTGGFDLSVGSRDATLTGDLLDLRLAYPIVRDPDRIGDRLLDGPSRTIDHLAVEFAIEPRVAFDSDLGKNLLGGEVASGGVVLMERMVRNPLWTRACGLG
jgi:superfamily II DNA/RNA helicase